MPVINDVQLSPMRVVLSGPAVEAWANRKEDGVAVEMTTADMRARYAPVREDVLANLKILADSVEGAKP